MTITKEGAIASFYTVNKAPIKHLKVYFSPKQAGEGTPSSENIRPIEGWDQFTLSCSNKGLVKFGGVGPFASYFNGYNDQWVKYNTTTVPIVDRNSYYTYSCYIDNINGTETSQVQVWFKDITNTKYLHVSSGNGIAVGTAGWSKVTFKPSSTDFFLGLGISLKPGAIASKGTLELGNTMTEYEPYQGFTQVINWSNDAGIIYGGYIDLITGELVQEQIGKTFKGSDADQIIEYTNTTRRRFRFYKTLKGNGETKAGVTCCDKLRYSYNEDDKLHYFFTDNNSNGNVYAYLPKDFGDNDEITFIASLYTPELVTTLSPIELQTFIGRNNIWSNADRVEVEYDLAESNDELYRRRNIILQGVPHLETATGDIANFNTDMVAPIKDAKIYFNPVQEGEGDPSPENIRPISGWTGLNIYQQGKNLIDINALTGTTSVWWKGKVVTGYSNHCVTPKIPVKPGATYRLNRNSNAQNAVCYFDKNGDYVDQETWDNYHPSRTIPDNVYFVGITIGTEYLNNPQPSFTVGSQVTDYVDYVQDLTIPINWINWNQLIIDGTFSDSSKWWAANSTYGTLSLSNNIATWTCTTTPQYYYQTGITERSNHLEIPENHKIYICAQVRSSIAERIALYALVGTNEHTSPFYANVRANEWTDIYGLVPNRSSGKIVGKGKVCYGTATANIGNIAVGTTLEAKNFMMFDLTQMFGVGNEPTVDEFHNTFTSSYYQYDLGQSGTGIGPILYGGNIDLINGTVTATYGHLHLTGASNESWWVYDVGSYQGFGLSGVSNIMKLELRSAGWSNWLKVDTQKEVNSANKFRCWLAVGKDNPFIYCVNIADVLSENTINGWKAYLASNPLDIIFPLATPITYQLTPQQIKTLKGTNNIWSNANDVVDIQYWTH